jgi:hypothetical protein
MTNRGLAFGAVVCFCLVFASPLLAEDDVKSTVTSIEKSLWEAWKNNEKAPFEQHLSDNSVAVTPRGVSSGKQQIIQEMTDQSCEVRDYSLSDWQVHQISDDTVIVTYQAKQNATCGGTKIPEQVVASSVYVRKGGQWLAASYHESPMEAGTRRAE